MNRRSLITGLVSFIAAPAIVRAGSLMPVRGVVMDGPVVPFRIPGILGYFASAEISRDGRTWRCITREGGIVVAVEELGSGPSPAT